MAHGILVLKNAACFNVDSYNRSAVGSADLDNGSAVILASRSSDADKGEVWVATQPATGSLTNLWMVAEPEIVVTDSKYKGLDPDVRNFFVPSGKVFSAIKPQVGDVIEISADGLAGTKSTNGYVVATNGAYKLTWAAAAISGLSLKLLATSYISIGTGAIDDQRPVVSYLFECVAIA